MSNTICKFSAGLIRGNAQFMAYMLQTSKTDLNMQPELKGKGRSILEQVQECAEVNAGLAGVFSGSQPVPPGAITDAESASNEIIASAERLATALEGMDASFVDKPYDLPFGKTTGQMALVIALNHMPYHVGQSNYIELLDGDSEFRIPPGLVESH